MVDVVTIGFKAEYGDLKEVQQALQRIVNEGKRLDKSNNNLQKSFVSLKGAIGLATAAATAFASSAVVRGIANFETAMNGLEATTRATTQQMALMERQARDLGATTTFSATEAAEAQRFLAQAGFDVNQILSSTPGVLKLAIAGNLDLAKAADIASNVLGGMSMNVSELNRVNDILAETAASSNTNILQLGDALSYAAPIASSAGLSLEETAAAIGTLSDAGLQSTRAGTGLLGIIRQLSVITPKAEAALNRYGITTDEVDISTRGLSAVLDTLGKAGINTSDAFEIFGSEAGVAAQILMSGSKRVEEFTGQLENASGAADKMASTMAKGITVEFKSLQSAVAETTLIFGDGGGRAGIVSALQVATTAVRDINTALQAASESTSGAGMSFEMLGTAIITATKIAHAAYTTIMQLAHATEFMLKVLNTEVSFSMFEDIANHTRMARHEISSLSDAHFAFLRTLEDRPQLSIYREMDTELEKISNQFDALNQKAVAPKVADIDNSATLNAARELEEERTLIARKWSEKRFQDASELEEQKALMARKWRQKDLDDERAASAMKVQIAMGVGGQLASAFGQLASMQNTQSKEGFENYKKMATAQATVSTSLAVMQAWASLPPPFNAIAAGLAASVGALQVAQIQSQEFTPSQTTAYAKGGVVDSPTFFSTPTSSSNVMGEAGAEAIMPLKRNSKGELGVDASGGMGKVQNINFSIQAVDAAGIDRLLMSRQALITNMVRRGS